MAFAVPTVDKLLTRTPRKEIGIAACVPSGHGSVKPRTGGGSVLTLIRTLPDKRLEAASTLVLAGQSGSGILPPIPLGKLGHFGSK
jgi:hypothetical protein